MNLKTLAEKVDLEEEEYQEMIDLFLQKTSQHLNQLKTAIARGDHGEVVQSAHSIKGSAATLGLSVISGIAWGVEANARNHNLNGAEKAIQAIQSEMERIAELISVNPVGRS